MIFTGARCNGGVQRERCDKVSALIAKLAKYIIFHGYKRERETRVYKILSSLFNMPTRIAVIVLIIEPPCDAADIWLPRLFCFNLFEVQWDFTLKFVYYLSESFFFDSTT